MHRVDLPILADAPGAVPIRLRDGRPAAEKLAELEAVLRRYVQEGALVAFSGGVDSAFLVWAAARAANGTGRLVALTTVSASTPEPDLEDARAFAASVGVEHVCVEGRELDSEEYLRNDRDRCYHCKSDLFSLAHDAARERRLGWILYGYTASDRHDVRPGHRAATEAGVQAPLSDVGLEKEEIRELLRTHGIALADKPASPCLSSRIQYGEEITPEKLNRIDRSERFLRSLGFRECRVRHHNNLARIEVPADQIERLCSPDVRAKVDAALREFGYAYVTIDARGFRSGSMNEVIAFGKRQPL